MKSKLLIALTAILLIGCGKDSKSPAGTPKEIVGGNEFTANATSISLQGSRNLTMGEARSILEANFAAITRVEVGMKWKEVSQRLIKSSSADSYCYEKSESTYEIIQILPAGTSSTIEGEAIKVSESGKRTAIEGDNCYDEIGKEVAFGPYEYDMEDHASGETVDSMMDGFSQLGGISVGTLNGRTAFKGSISFEGVNYTFVDYADQPTIVGTYIVHYQQEHGGKLYQNVTQITPIN